MDEEKEGLQPLPHIPRNLDSAAPVEQIVMDGINRMMTTYKETELDKVKSQERLEINRDNLRHQERLGELRLTWKIILSLVLLGGVGGVTAFVLGKPDAALVIISSTTTGVLGLFAGESLGSSKDKENDHNL